MTAIKLRAMEPEDLDLLYQIENNMQLWNVSATNVPYSRYLLHDYIAHASGDIYTDKQVRLMIENERQEAIGVVDIVDFDPQHRRAELGLLILDSYRKRGYGEATLARVLDYSLRVLHLHQLYAIVNAEHGSTLRLFQKNSFTADTVLKSWLYDGSSYHDAILLQHIF